MNEKCKQCDEKQRQIMEVLEDLQDRACREGILETCSGLCEFTDYIRGLYPEYYSKA